MNFNKDYPIAILDTNIAITVPNILNILKGCNIVILYTLIDELDKVKKENAYGVRNFVNNFLALSEKANLSKDGYKLENDCMLYLDIDKNNSYHKDINLDSKKQDIKFIAEAKNLKEKYNDMEVVLISSDKIMKITASIFDVKVKFLEEFITEYLKEEFKLNILFDLLVESKHYYDEYIKRVAKYIEINSEENYYRVSEIIFKIVSDNKDIDGLYKLSESYNPNEEVYKKIFEILSENKDIDGLYKLVEYYNNAYERNKALTILTGNREVYKKIFEILSENRDIDGLYKLSESYNPNEEVYKKISNILVENKDTEGLYKLAENILKLVNKPKKEIYEVYKKYKDYINYYGYDEEKAIREIEKFKIDILENIYNKIFTILAENKDAKGLVELLKNEDVRIFEFEWFGLDDDEEYNSVKLICITISRIFNTLLESKNGSKLLELAEIENNYIEHIKNNQNNYRDNNIIENFKREISEIYNKSFEILSENKDIDRLYKLSESYNPNEEVYKKIFEILSDNKDIDGLYKLLAEAKNNDDYYSREITSKIYEKLFKILSEAEDLEGLFKLAGKYNNEAIYEKICEILDKEKDKNKLYELTKNNKDIKNLLSNSSHPKINEIMLKMLYR